MIATRMTDEERKIAEAFLLVFGSECAIDQRQRASPRWYGPGTRSRVDARIYFLASLGRPVEKMLVRSRDEANEAMRAHRMSCAACRRRAPQTLH